MILAVIRRSRWDSAGLHRFCRIVSRNSIRSANRSALLFILVPLVKTEPAENITFAIKPADKKFDLNSAPKPVTSGGAHLSHLMPEQHSFEERSQQQRAVGDNV